MTQTRTQALDTQRSHPKEHLYCCTKHPLPKFLRLFSKYFRFTEVAKLAQSPGRPLPGPQSEVSTDGSTAMCGLGLWNGHRKHGTLSPVGPSWRNGAAPGYIHMREKEELLPLPTALSTHGVQDTRREVRARQARPQADNHITEQTWRPSSHLVSSRLQVGCTSWAPRQEHSVQEGQRSRYRAGAWQSEQCPSPKRRRHSNEKTGVLRKRMAGAPGGGERAHWDILTQRDPGALSSLQHKHLLCWQSGRLGEKYIGIWCFSVNIKPKVKKNIKK